MKKTPQWTPPKLLVNGVTPEATVVAAALVQRLRMHGGTQEVNLCVAGNSLREEIDCWRLTLGDKLPILERPDGVSWQIDFRRGKVRHRAAEHNRSQQPLARAVGIARLSADERANWHVLDGTAGAGADGWQLAAAGASVTLVEQHPVLHALLRAALEAAATDTETKAIASQITLVNDSIENVVNQTAANAIYLDPMYPVRRSKAAVKKPMQFIQGLVGKGPEPETMLATCLQALKQPSLNRVVVKRPAEAEPLLGSAVSGVQLITVDAGAARFDVYLRP